VSARAGQSREDRLGRRRLRLVLEAHDASLIFRQISSPAATPRETSSFGISFISTTSISCGRTSPAEKPASLSASRTVPRASRRVI
jgi:hypothetical protein